MRMKARDLYRLRRLQLNAQRRWLMAQLAQQQVQEFSLELERRYGLVARDAALDARTGQISVAPGGDAQEEASDGPANHAG